jgi:hypothetical protein
MQAMDGRLPLPTLLSFALVAFTIECDNETESRTPHRTTRHGVKMPAGVEKTTGRSPWLISLAMYMNCLRFLEPEGLPLAELERRARTHTNLLGMQRWGLVTFAPDPSRMGASPRARPPQSTWIVALTRAGTMVRQVFEALLPEVETRWQARFGSAELESLRSSLVEIASQLDPGLPDSLPILGYGLHPGEYPVTKLPPDLPVSFADLPLPALLSRVLFAFALEFESQSEVSYAICANVLRLLGSGAARIRDLPQSSGVSKEAIDIAVGFLTRHGFATQQPEAPGSKIKAIALTAKGEQVRARYLTLLPETEDRWRSRYGAAVIDRLHAALSQLIAESPESQLPLMRAIEAHPDGWRAKLPKPTTLPHYPLVSHRGGYPDGS